MDLLQSLPENVLFQTVESYSLDEILNLCTTNKDLNRKLCENENFWQYRYFQDYGTFHGRNPNSWREAYQKRSIQVVVSLNELNSPVLLNTLPPKTNIIQISDV